MSLDPRTGGPGEFVRALLRYASSQYAGEVVTFDDPGAAYLKDLPYPVHALGPNTSVYGDKDKLIAWLTANRSRFDGAIVNGLWQCCGYAALRALHGKIPYVVFSHGMLDPYFKRRFPLKHLKKWVYWLLAEYWVLRNAHRVLFTTDAESRLAEESFWLHRWRGFVVPFGADRPPKDGATLREAFYTAHPHLRDRRVMLFLGRIHRKKGCDLLIASFLRFASHDPDLHLVMAGPDQQGWVPELQQRVADAGLSARVHWPGMLDGDVKWGSIFASEVFILPSHQENFGIAVAEALACGVPVLLADKVNIAPEIAADGAGLIEPDTQQGADHLVRRWIEMDQQTREAMRVQALRTFDARYDMRKNVDSILSLFAANPKSA
jgi:glycosyltransferase involved in cell wall biosynthesis